MILSNLGHDEDSTIKVHPLDKKCKPKIKIMHKHPVDHEEVSEKHGVIIITKTTEFTREDRVKWKYIIATRGAGFWSLFIHKLTYTNIKDKQMKIMQALNMQQNGKIILRGNSDQPLQATYSHCADGRMVISDIEWGHFVHDNALEIGQKIMLIFHPCEDITDSPSSPE